METTSKFDQKVQTWLSLSHEGRFFDAKSYYYENLFDDIIHKFTEREDSVINHQNKVLFSMLGFTPEPIILTQRAMNPSVHVIFTTNSEDSAQEDSTNECLGRFLTSQYKVVKLEDDDFSTIYGTLKEHMLLYAASEYTIDVTGGKKSMVASAAIFARDYNCNVVYVDYEKYLKELRSPMPGTERLKWVYKPYEDLPEIKFFQEKDSK